MKGVIYLMKTVAPSLVKIGKTTMTDYTEHIAEIQRKGYYSLMLKPLFAIAVEDHEKKEENLKELFKTHRIGDSDMFSLEGDKLKELLMCYEGSVVFSDETDKQKETQEKELVTERNKRFDFYKRGIKRGGFITFITDETITAIVVSENTVEYNGKIWRLSPLVHSILEKKGQLNKSGAYQGSLYFKYNGVELNKIKTNN